MAKEYFNENWLFCSNFKEEYLRCTEFTKDFYNVRLPHTCKELPLHYFDESEYQMVSCYVKSFKAQESWRERNVMLTFEGVAHACEVYLNGERVQEHLGGYTAFEVDLSEKLSYERENILLVKVNSKEDINVPPFGYVIDYMTYGGIYRDVYLQIREKQFIDDVFVRSEILDYEKGKANLKVDVRLSKKCETKECLQIYLKREHTEELLKKCTLDAGEREVKVQIPVEDVIWWDIENPKLYGVIVRLENGEEYSLRFGFREACFQADGFYLNGKKIKIRGLNRHQSYPYVGYAMPKSMQRQDADILKYELGCNAVRTSHYPQSHYFIERCDEIGLLVFTEIPGWQHIGDEAWKDIAVNHVREMVSQYRNHTSIILWGVRINESADDEEFYKRTNEVAHSLDDSRQTGGVRAHTKSQLLEDVYTYNDFVHDGVASGCQKKEKVTSDMKKGYLVSEYNGHMYPTKMFDKEEDMVEHAMRHVRVLDAVAGEKDIAGSFGWCMFDYNTHKDFGSGDRICYHGVMDMFRNPKLASTVYQMQQEKETVLMLSSSMDIGEHPGCNRGATYILTNADSVRMYKNDRFIKEYFATDSKYRNLKHGPIEIDDYIGDRIHKQEAFTKHQADIIKDSLNHTARHGYGKYPLSIIWKVIQCMVFYHMKPTEAVVLYNKYVGDWGGTATVYRFEAIKDGKVVKTITKEPSKSIYLETKVSHTTLVEEESYDVAEVRIEALDQNQNRAVFANEPLQLRCEGGIELVGSSLISLQGGCAGVYVKSTGKSGTGILHIKNPQMGERKIAFCCKCKE